MVVEIFLPQYHPSQTWSNLGLLPIAEIASCRVACRSAVEVALRHGRKCCARRPRRQMRPHTASGGRRQMHPRAASGGPRFCPFNGSGGWPRWQRSEHDSSSGRRLDARRRAGRRPGSPPPRRLTRPVATFSKGSSSGCRSAGRRPPLQASALQRGRSSRAANCWRSMRRRCWVSSTSRRRAAARHPAQGRHRRHLWSVGHRP